MDIMESIRAGFKELIVPELDKIREENREIRAILEITNKRLDDVNTHLADQSRRIDAVRVELSQRIDSVREELSQRIDSVREELSQRIDSVREELSQRINSVREELSLEIKHTHKRIDEANDRIDETNKRIDAMKDHFGTRLDRLYEVVVRRDEHGQVVQRLLTLEREVAEIKRKLAA